MFTFTSSSQLGGIYHVGTLNIANKSRQSHEWNGLSVSNCPDAWRQICGCSGTCWELVPQGGADKFLLVHDLDDGDRTVIRQWAIDAGYFAPDVEYRVYWYDDEYEEERYFVFGGDEKQQALSEYEAKIDEECDGVRFEEIGDGLIATPKLESMSLVSMDVSMFSDIAAMLYAEYVLGCDGLWWEDRYDPWGLSAPRGVIFNSHVGRYTTRDVDEGPGRY